MLLLPSSFHSLFMHTFIHWSIFLNSIGSGKSIDLRTQIPRFSLSWPRTPRKIALPRFPYHFKKNIMTPTTYCEAPLRICADALGSVCMRKGLHRPQPTSMQAQPWHSGHRKPDELPQCLHSKVPWLHRVRHTTAASTGGQRRKDLCENK